MLQNQGIKIRLLFAFALSSLFVFGIGVMNNFELHQVVGFYDHISDENLPNGINVSEMRRALLITETSLYRLGSPALKETEVTEIKTKIREMEEVYQKAAVAYEAVPFVEGEEEIYKRVTSGWKNFEELEKKAEAMTGPRGATDPIPYFSFLNANVVKSSSETRQAMRELAEFHAKQAEKWTKMAKEHASSANLVSVLLMLLGGLVSMFMGWLLARSVSNHLSMVIHKVENNSREVGHASERFLQQSTTLSEGATEQAAAIQETAAAIDEVSAMIKKNSENAHLSATSSAESRSTAQQGRDTVLNMIRSIEEISQSNNEIMQQVEQSNREFAEIVKVIGEIGTKTKVINDIVFQTKLLSFNASVEAARAGEHGKGFAVVAEEVGNLAQMSGNAAKEISNMLEGSIQRVEGIVTQTKQRVEVLIQNGRHKVETGTEVARRCGDSLEQILGAVQSVDSRVSEIASASKEQAQGVSEINTAMNQLDQTTQQSATVARQTADASTHLARQAEELSQAVVSLKEVLSGKGRSQVAVKRVGTPPKVSSRPAADVHKMKPEPSKKKVVVQAAQPKKAVGDYEVPSMDDPRFEDL